MLIILIKNIEMYYYVEHLSFHKFSLQISQYYINYFRDYTNALLI